MKNLAAFNVRKVKRAAAGEKEGFPLQKDSGSQSKMCSHPNKLSEN